MQPEAPIEPELELLVETAEAAELVVAMAATEDATTDEATTLETGAMKTELVEEVVGAMDTDEVVGATKMDELVGATKTELEVVSALEMEIELLVATAWTAMVELLVGAGGLGIPIHLINPCYLEFRISSDIYDNWRGNVYTHSSLLP